MEPRASKRTQEDNRLRLEAWKRSFREFNWPDQAKLEASVEGNSKCGKCGGEIRAVVLKGQKADATSYDLEILVSIHCRDASCDWKTEQWRPWSRHEPNAL